MKRRILACALLAATIADTAWAQTYGDTLLAAARARHREIAAMAIASLDKNGRPIAVTSGSVVKAETRTSEVPLHDALGKTIGTLTIIYRTSASAARTAAIESAMARRIYVADNLAEADPFVAGARRAPRAQALVEKMIDSHAGLVTLAMHVAPPGGENIILASNFGRIGKLADDDDRDVIANGTIRRELTNKGQRLAVELPQLDRSGKVIGALSTSFTIAPDSTEAQAYERAIALRDQIARLTPSLAALVK